MKVSWPYLETSLFGFYFDDQPHNTEKKEAVQILLDQIEHGLFHAVFSSYTYLELRRPSPFQKKLIDFIAQRPWPIVDLPLEETQALVQRYLQEGALQPEYETDAFHVAAATVLEADMLVSLNLKHIVNT